MRSFIYVVLIGIFSAMACDNSDKSSSAPRYAEWSTQFSAGNGHTLAIDKEGNLWGWGDDDAAKFGSSKLYMKIQKTPTQINNNKWRMACASMTGTSALKADNTVWGWGLEVTSYQYDPIQKGNASNLNTIACTNNHTLAIDKDGNLWGWGYNGQYQLCDRATVSKDILSTPIKINSNKKWISVAAGSLHSVGVKEDGSLWLWGSNNYEINNILETLFKQPTRIGIELDWKAVFANGNYTLALKKNGELWGWGTSVVLNGTTTKVTTKVRVGAVSDRWQYVSAGYNHVLAQKDDGSLWSWGSNTYGQLGNGRTDNSSIPVKIAIEPGLSWVAFSAGNGYSIALKSDGTLWAWGNNNSYQLGDGTGKNQKLPVKVSPGIF